MYNRKRISNRYEGKYESNREEWDTYEHPEVEGGGLSGIIWVVRFFTILVLIISIPIVLFDPESFGGFIKILIFFGIIEIIYRGFGFDKINQRDYY